MSLFIRVLNGFYTHRKTLRLRIAIGDAAFWVPPRIWAYASANQPDGCFKQYSAEELAMLVAYTGDAQAMLEAMLVAGFMDPDPLRIHDWEEHNGYHAFYADRAKKAATVRWAKARHSEKTVQYSTVQEPSIASSMLGASAIKKTGRLHGIPATVDEVIRYGRTTAPPVPEDRCRAFFAHYEGQAKTSLGGDIFWITSGDTVVTNWKIKLPEFRGAFSSGQASGPVKRPPKPHVDAFWDKELGRWT